MNDAQVSMPKSYDFGSGAVVELSYLEDVLGISRKAARAWLKALHIPPIVIGTEVYFSLPTFQRIMFVLMRPGGPGFAFPGAPYKKDDDRLKEVTPDILKQAMDPMTLAEMNATTSPDSVLLRKILDYQSKVKWAETQKGRDNAD
jgi:hypothetical protein